MNFRELDPDVVRKMLEAKDENGNLIYQDVLKGQIEKEAVFFRNSSCPKCREYNHETFVNLQRPFTPGVALPNKLLRCLSCQTEFDPYTGLVTRVTSEST
jgi:hypothetical protein